MPRDPKDGPPANRLPEDRLAADRLIVALDVDSLDRATGLVDALAGQVTRFKIGSQLFTAEGPRTVERSEEHTSELQSLRHLVCRLLLEKKKNKRPIALADVIPS